MHRDVKKVIDDLEWLEGMHGPATLEEYVAVLTVVKLDIEQRIATAAKRFNGEDA